MFEISMFGFRALWSPYFLLFLFIITIGFFYSVFKRQQKYPNEIALTKKQGIFFILSIILLYIVKGSPVDLLGHIMFTFHMIAMAILYLLIPPLLIVSIPNWMWEQFFKVPVIRQFFQFFTKPIIALIMFNGMFSFYHVPFIFDFIKTDVIYHSVYTFVLFIFAMFMWWPLMNQYDEELQLSGLKKIGYLFADGVLLTPACALIIFADSPMYATYTDPQLWTQAMKLCVPADLLSQLTLSGPEMFNIMPAKYDQQLGGVIMKILQEIIYGSILFVVFLQWYRKEQKDNQENVSYEPRLLKE